jgi:predicted phage baseplate assembly protein
VREEVLGQSDGNAGQVFHLQHAPVLALQEGETVQVEEKREGELVLVPWERVQDFAVSGRHERHFGLDEATGEVCFGPCVRQPDGAMRQYGRVPEAGRRVRVSQYRHGGGVVGNVPAGRLQVLRSAIPYIDGVSNLRRASGGRDQESLDEAKLRARRELRAQQRAVTAEDFELLSRGASRAVARVRCNAPGNGNGGLPPGMVELLVVPAAFEALRAGDVSQLALDPELKKAVRTHMDQYRLLTTTLNVREPDYLGVSVRAEIVPAEYSQPEVVQARVVEALRAFISPLVIGDDGQDEDELLGPGWEGWPFGRDLYAAEIYALIQRVPGVKHVLDVQLDQRPLILHQELSPAAKEGESASSDAGASEDTGEAPPLVQRRMIRVPPDTLLCSLEHQVSIVEL